MPVGDDADPADLDRLEALDDAALARLAYGRAETPESRMLAQRAARILASRRPAPPPVAAPTALGAPPVALPRAAGPEVGDAATPEITPGAEEVPVGRDRAPGWMLAVAAIAVVALGIGAAVASLPAEPAAFAIFADEADPEPLATEAVYADRLATAGERLLSPARVIASTDLVDGGTIDMVAYRTGRPGAPADARQVCVALFGTLGTPAASPRRWERTCLPEPEFLADGLDGVLALTGARVEYRWPVASDPRRADEVEPASVSFRATGPRTVTGVYALDSTALILLPESDRAPSPLVASITSAAHPPGMPPIVLGPVELARVDDEAILIGFVAEGAIPGSELVVCAVAAQLGVARGTIENRCIPVTQFVAGGVGSEASPNAGVGTFSFRWESNNAASLTILRPSD